jgi:hypothetical protein
MAESARLLIDLARTGPAAAWLDEAMGRTADPASPAFRALHASVPRRLGQAARERPDPPPALVGVARPHVTWTDWVRAALVANVLGRLPDAAQPPALLRLFEGGEIGEQESLLRVLPLLDAPSRFVDTGLQGARTNAQRVFEAIACENPFPAAHFPELGMNQLVMKAIFIEVPVARIEGLGERLGPELLRMLAGYKSERLAAGRPVPADVDRLLEGTTR